MGRRVVWVGNGQLLSLSFVVDRCAPLHVPINLQPQLVSFLLFVIESSVFRIFHICLGVCILIFLPVNNVV